MDLSSLLVIFLHILTLLVTLQAMYQSSSSIAVAAVRTRYVPSTYRFTSLLADNRPIRVIETLSMRLHTSGSIFMHHHDSFVHQQGFSYHLPKISVHTQCLSICGTASRPISTSTTLFGQVNGQTEQDTIDLAKSHDIRLLPDIIMTSGIVQNGYGRGSKKLGFPTCNLPQFESNIRSEGFQRGVYFGWAYLPSDVNQEMSSSQTSGLYGIVANIGKSPTFVGQVRKFPSHAPGYLFLRLFNNFL